MGQIVCRVNIDFEKQAFYKTSKVFSKKEEDEWEYLLWWLEDEEYVLKDSPKNNYLKNDLEYISQITKRKIFFEKSEKAEFLWWGNPRERVFLKKDLPKIRVEVFADESSYMGTPKNYPCVLKKDGFFGGRGTFFLQNKDQFEALGLENDEHLIEPFRKRVQDFSSYTFKTETIYYETIIDKKGMYKGSVFRPHLNWLKNEKNCLESTQKLQKYLRDQNLHDHYGVDQYFYQNKDQIYLEPLCEINQRKTIASCCYLIYKKYFSQYSYAMNLLFFNKKKKKSEDLRENNIILLSPTHKMFSHYLILANSENDLFLLRDKLEKFFNGP